MTVHIVSVGLSLLEVMATPGNPRSRKMLAQDRVLIGAITTGRPHRLFAEAGATDRQGACIWLAGALTPPEQEGHDPAAAADLTATSGQVRPELWPSTISAELSTFARVFGGDRARLAKHDTAVLVTSDTSDGLLSAVWNALALTAGDLRRVTLLTEPPCTAGDLGPVPGQAIIARIPGMDAGTERGFHQAMEQLGLLGHALHHHPDLSTDAGVPFEFHLSGGFKASIPYLIGLAEGLRSLPGARQVQAWVLHETTANDSTPIRVPLRRAVPEGVREELAGFDLGTGRRSRVPDEDFLEGYAYDTHEDGQTLTPFGRGLLALFGDRLQETLPS